MELFSSDEEESQIEYWNNWWPSDNPLDQIMYERCKKVTMKERSGTSNLEEMPSINSPSEILIFGNWIPPRKFLNNLQTLRKTIRTKTYKNHRSQDDNEVVTTEASHNSKKNFNSFYPWRKEANLIWGHRMLLDDANKFSEGDSIWGIINLGVFAHIKIWINEYGNICCLAAGEISELGSSEKTFISITNIHLLRKMLNLTNAQWISLCEIVQETKTTLNFDAFQDYDMAKQTSLERMWFFICKRRHFIQNQCMLFKFCGAVKCLREFKIIPKLLVQDIRNLLGEQII